MVSTILDNKYKHFGLTELEVIEMLNYYKVDYELNIVKQWYNGYNFGNELVYNPWSIINYVFKGQIAPYWVNTSENSLINNLQFDYLEELSPELEKIYSGEAISIPVNEAIPFDELDQLDNIWSLLLFMGYLTTIEQPYQETLVDIPKYQVAIPNIEVFSFFRTNFMKIGTKTRTNTYEDIMSYLKCGNIEEFRKRFKVLFKQSISYYDADKQKKFYHQFMLGFLLYLNYEYKVISNREYWEGRVDIALEPYDKNLIGFIFEFKVANSQEDLQTAVQIALEQINDRGYAEEMKANGIQKVLKLGFAFYKKSVEIAFEHSDS